MRKTMLAGVMFAAAVSIGIAGAQTVKEDTSTAGHATADASKTVAHKTASGTKTGYHKTVNGTKDLGDKISGKPVPPRSDPPQF